MAYDRNKALFKTFDRIVDYLPDNTRYKYMLNKKRTKYRDKWLNNEYKGTEYSKYITDEIKEAWADGHTGEGVTINIVDVFKERPAGYAGHRRGTSSHGGKVEAIITGGVQYDKFQQGIAPDSTVNRFSQLGNASFEQMFKDADIVTFTTTYGITRDMDYKFAMPETDALLVVAAGNYQSKCTTGNHKKNHCSKLALSSALGKNADNTLIIGGIYNNTNNLHISSSKAGVTKDSFVVDNVTVPFKWDGIKLSKYSTKEYHNSGGTSFSTALVAGKAAIIKSKFPHLNGKQLANVIKMTADDLGAPGVDEIYGHGRVNLTRALSPAGSLR